MKTFFVALIMILSFVRPVRPEALSPLAMCQEKSPNFSRLTQLYDEIGPMSTLLERMKQLQTKVEPIKERLERSLLTAQVSAEERRQVYTFWLMGILLQNCMTWHDLRLLLQGALQLQTTSESEHWRTYLEQRHIQGVEGLEELVQQVKMLLQKFEQSDPTKPFDQQMTTEVERQWFNDTKRKLAVLDGFERWLKSGKAKLDPH